MEGDASLVQEDVPLEEKVNKSHFYRDFYVAWSAAAVALIPGHYNGKLNQLFEKLQESPVSFERIQEFYNSPYSASFFTAWGTIALAGACVAVLGNRVFTKQYQSQ